MRDCSKRADRHRQILQSHLCQVNLLTSKHERVIRFPGDAVLKRLSWCPVAHPLSCVPLEVAWHRTPRSRAGAGPVIRRFGYTRMVIKDLRCLPDWAIAHQYEQRAADYPLTPIACFEASAGAYAGRWLTKFRPGQPPNGIVRVPIRRPLQWQSVRLRSRSPVRSAMSGRRHTAAGQAPAE